MSTSNAIAVTVVGAGPAGLMAAEQLADAGIAVSIYDAMPAAGRKFLRAGIGGLNLTHAEPHAQFVERYSAPEAVGAWLSGFNAEALRVWAAELGVETFVGSSGRVFPAEKKAAPLLRAWLRRLHSKPVAFKWRHRFVGWNAAGDLRFTCGADEHAVPSQVTIFALGGASWARLGSDGRWAAAFAERGVDCAAFRPANCGFTVDWSPVMQRHAGAPLKSVGLTVLDGQRAAAARKGEAMISAYGLEGSLIYALSAVLREQVARNGWVDVQWDLSPDRTPAEVEHALRGARARDSVSNVLRKRLHISGARAALLWELAGQVPRHDPAALAAAIKCLPQRLLQPRPLDEAISTAGGVRLDALTEHLMLKRHPGIFCAGEMLDWEAPTGGYLLNACLASGRVAGQGAVAYLRHRSAS